MSHQRPLSERLAKLPSGQDLVASDYVAQSQRERILLATVDLVAERGYQKMTIELIAKSSRVALSTFYDHFSSKEDCFLAALDESISAAAEVFAELIDPALPWVDQIATGLNVLLEMVAKERSRARLCIVEAQAAGGASLARYQAALEGVAPKLRQGRALNPRGASLPDGLEIALAGGIAWLIHKRLLNDEIDELHSLMPEMLQVVLTPYVGEEAAVGAADEAQARAVA